MSVCDDWQRTKGTIQIRIDYKDGRDSEEILFNNTVLRLGRYALAGCLTNEIGNVFQFYISRMLFGDGGTVGGVPQYVDAGRTGLFGTTRVTKPVVAQRDQNNLSQAIFTAVMTYADGNGYTLNEMALQLNTTDLFSMATFPDFTKTEQMQMTFNWYLQFC